MGYTLPTFIYSQPLNNMGLNCAGPLISGFFSMVSAKVLHSLWLVESADAELWIQRAGYKVICRFFIM